MEKAKQLDKQTKKQAKVQLDIFSSYVAAIENSIGAKVFKNLYGYVDGEKKDILEDGRFACASFASSILVIFGLLEERHATVAGTVRDMERSGWHKIEEPKKGAVLVWLPSEYTHGHRHIGFCVDHNEAISNNTKKGFPVRHPWKGHWGDSVGTDIGEERVVESIWWHPKLESKKVS